MSDAPTNSNNAPAMPLFYKNPVSVNIDRHKDLKVRRNRLFRYAARAHAVPALLDEVPTLCSYYPLVFTPGDSPAMVALLGVRPEENLLIGADGTWTPNWPIPAYVTRYPFIMIHIAEENRLVMLMEEDADVVGTEGDFPLFADGQPSKEGQEILNYCAAFHRSVEATQAFCKELNDRGLLVEQRADLVTADRQQISLTGFRIIDEQKFNALPDDVFLNWRRQGWVGIAYSHFLSLSRWQGLIGLIDARAKAA